MDIKRIQTTMGWHFSDQLSVTVHGTLDPSDEEWQSYLDDLRSLPNVADIVVLVYSEGGGPKALHRAALERALAEAGKPKVRVALVSANRVMRGIGTAISWFNPHLRVFAPSKLDAALGYLELEPDGAADARRRLCDLGTSLKIDVGAVLSELDRAAQ